MLDNETYQREMVRMFDSIRETHKWEKSCEGVDCRDCPLQVQKTKARCDNPFNVVKIYNAVEKWSKEHQPQKYKVSKWEDEKPTLIQDVLRNCEVVDDDIDKRQEQ